MWDQPTALALETPSYATDLCTMEHLHLEVTPQAAGLIAEFPPLVRVLETRFAEHSQLIGWFQSLQAFECREDWRVSFRQLLPVLPYYPALGIAQGELALVSGRNISWGGMAFGHQGPFPCQDLLVILDWCGDVAQAVHMHVAWCRFTSRNGYVSGGRMMTPMTFPLKMPRDWNHLPQL